MKVDFWQLSRDPVERVVALIAARTRKAGERLLVVDPDSARRDSIARALWAADGVDFLANGHASAPHAERQPILLGEAAEPLNGARYAVFADGRWREEGDRFARVFVLFADDGIDEARRAWRLFAQREDVERGFYVQDERGWTKKG